MKRGMIALTALVAAGAGYVGGLLSAPRSGKRTRRKIAQSASKTMTDGEKQLKKLHSEVNVNIKQVEKQITKARTKANNERRQAVKSAKEARQKARMLLTALHEGDADDPNLKAVIQEVSSAKKHLSEFIKSSNKPNTTKKKTSSPKRSK